MERQLLIAQQKYPHLAALKRMSWTNKKKPIHFFTIDSLKLRGVSEEVIQAEIAEVTQH